MSETLERNSSLFATTEFPDSLPLELKVVDRDSIAELSKYPEGELRDDFALEALKIGVLTLRRTSVSLDGDLVKKEMEGFLSSLTRQLDSHANITKERIETSLGQYFHPDSGQFSQRVKQLTAADGEFNKVIRELIDGDGSRLVTTIVAQVGENSPFMRYLSPNQTTGFLASLKSEVEIQLKQQNEMFSNEFSLDNSEGALRRLIGEITAKHGDFSKSLDGKINDVVKEFSLNEENSALSRLVKKVNTAQETITQQFSLDNDESCLKRMQNHLGAILSAHIETSQEFQKKVEVALGQLVTKRQVEARGTQHGFTFEDTVLEFIAKDCQPRGDIFESTGKRVGSIKNCQKGDGVLELGCDNAAAGAKIVIEAKEDASFNLTKAREEIDTARKNREAQFGVFVFSQKTAPVNCESLSRIGNDIFVVWDADDLASDARLKAAIEIARVLCIRDQKSKKQQSTDFSAIDSAILEIERTAGKYDDIRKFAESIQSANEKILERVRKDRKSLEKQIEILRDSVGDLKNSITTTSTE